MKNKYQLNNEGFAFYLNKGITDREMQLLAILFNHSTNKEYGAHLFISEKTVKFHFTAIYKKLGCRSRSEVMVKNLQFYIRVEQTVEVPKVEKKTPVQKVQKTTFELPKGASV